MNQILFGIIGLLMLAIVGVGGSALYTHPEAVATVAGNISARVESFVGGSNTPNVASSNTNNTAVVSDDGNDQEGDDDNDDKAASAAVSQTTTTNPTPTPQPATVSPGTFTLAQIKTHNSSASCYTAINGSVYDVTTFITQHPGGASAILSLCGTDGSAAFDAQHGGQRRPASELASFKIGTLAQ